MEEQKKRIADIVDPMLMAGAARSEIKRAIADQRPDFKSPNAAISNRVRALQDGGQKIILSREPKVQRRAPIPIERVRETAPIVWRYQWPTTAELAAVLVGVKQIWP